MSITFRKGYGTSKGGNFHFPILWFCYGPDGLGISILGLFIIISRKKPK